MPRCFVAVELSEEIRGRVAAAVDPVRSDLRSVRWVRRENWHITLKFLGEVAEERIPAVTGSLAAAFSTVPPFHIELASAGVFPPGRRPRVFWLGVAVGGEKLRDLAERTDLALMDLGFEPEGKPFQSHLTVGRAKEGVRQERDPDTMWRKLAAARFGSMEVREAVLFESQLFPEGPKYSVRARVALAGRGS